MRVTSSFRKTRPPTPCTHAFQRNAAAPRRATHREAPFFSASLVSSPATRLALAVSIKIHGCLGLSHLKIRCVCAVGVVLAFSSRSSSRILSFGEVFLIKIKGTKLNFLCQNPIPSTEIHQSDPSPYHPNLTQIAEKKLAGPPPRSAHGAAAGVLWGPAWTSARLAPHPRTSTHAGTRR